VKAIHNPYLTGIRCLLLVLTLSYVESGLTQTSAKTLFEDTQELVYQIRVIDIASGDKYSIGSGFLISDEGHIASNFHVVSSFVHEPDKYRLEYVSFDGSTGALDLVAVDVIHDLAITSSGETSSGQLALSAQELSKGDRIYSMGNPHDLGMTIIEGTFNGLVENSRYRKILFSGSLNAGMSGGPALNQNGEVIGINVSKGGEQISFLVPVEHLSLLQLGMADSATSPDFPAEIRSLLIADQQEFYQGILNTPLLNKQIGKLTVAGKLVESLHCWGHTADEEDARYEAVHQHCRSEDDIFISDRLQAGEFNYDIEFMHSTELNRFQFYNLLEERFTHPAFYNANNKEDVTNYRCHDGVISLASGSWKTSTCFRAYKNYADLYDASMIMVSMDFPGHAAIVKMGATAITFSNAQAIFKRIMENVEWTR
jgi:serine protease Do